MVLLFLFFYVLFWFIVLVGVLVVIFDRLVLELLMWSMFELVLIDLFVLVDGVDNLSFCGLFLFFWWVDLVFLEFLLCLSSGLCFSLFLMNLVSFIFDSCSSLMVCWSCGVIIRDWFWCIFSFCIILVMKIFVWYVFCRG